MPFGYIAMTTTKFEIWKVKFQHNKELQVYGLENHHDMIKLGQTWTQWRFGIYFIIIIHIINILLLVLFLIYFYQFYCIFILVCLPFSDLATPKDCFLTREQNFVTRWDELVVYPFIRKACVKICHSYLDDI